MIAAFLTDGEREVKSASLARFGFNPYASAVPFHYLFADGQADAGAWILPPIVQTLKDQKNASAYWASMPMPLSRTEKSHSAPSRRPTWTWAAPYRDEI